MTDAPHPDDNAHYSEIDEAQEAERTRQEVLTRRHKKKRELVKKATASDEEDADDVQEVAKALKDAKEKGKQSLAATEDQFREKENIRPSSPGRGGEPATPRGGATDISAYKARVGKQRVIKAGESSLRDSLPQRDVSLPTRFDPDGGVPSRPESPLARSLRDSARFAVDKVGRVQPTAPPTAIEALDFFTKIADPIDEQKPKEEPPAAAAPRPIDATVDPAAAPAAVPAAVPAPGAVPVPPAPAPTPAPAPAKEKKQEPTMNAAGIVEYKPAIYKSRHEWDDMEEKLYFRPSFRETPFEQKVIEEGKQPRYIEKEGLYVGKKPNVMKRNRNKMENRSIEQFGKGNHLLGEDGTISALPDPLYPKPTRPALSDKSPEQQTVFGRTYIGEFNHRYIDGSMVNRGDYQIDVDVNSLRFHHHHLFSEEHVLVQRILKLHESYSHRVERKVVELLNDKLQALKIALENVNQILNGIQVGEHNTVFVAEQQRRINELRLQIKATRKERDEEESADRTLLKNLMLSWKQLKLKRTNQGFTNTNLQMKIKKIDVNEEEDKRRVEEEIREELAEEKEIAEKEIAEKTRLFNEQRDLWKNSKLEKKNARIREKKREKAKTRPGADAALEPIDLQQQAADREILNKPDVPKPEKLAKSNLKDLEKTVRDRYLAMHRLPGEPIIITEISFDAAIDDTDGGKLSPEEKSRRNEVGRTKIFVKILFNDRDGPATSSTSLGGDFTVHFGQILSLQIVEWPERLVLQIFEMTGNSSSLLTEIPLMVPDVRTTVRGVQLSDYSFISQKMASRGSKGVGNNIQFSFDADPPQTKPELLTTNGKAMASAAWAVTAEGRVLIPYINTASNALSGTDAISALGMASMTDLAKLNKWISEADLDPNDPFNAQLIHGVRDAENQFSKIETHFRLDPSLEQFNFCTDEEIKQTLRFRVLALRNQGVPELRDEQKVPLFDYQVKCKAKVEEYDKKVHEKQQLSAISGDWHGPNVSVEVQRRERQKFIRDSREKFIERVRAASSKKSFTDIIHETELANVQAVFLSLSKHFGPKRELRPDPGEKTRFTPSQLVTNNNIIFVTVKTVTDIPTRFYGSSGEPSTVLGRPYVVAKFMEQESKSKPVEMRGDTFIAVNQTFDFTFKTRNNDYSFHYLQSLCDPVVIHLYDRVTEIDSLGGKIIGDKWLGTLSIPFSTILLYEQIQKKIPLEQPLAFIGYKKTKTTMIEVSIGINFPLQDRDPIRERFATHEDKDLLTTCDEWVATLRAKHKDREYKTTVCDVVGNSVFLCRFIKPLKPPDFLFKDLRPDLTLDEKLEVVARFVAMIPSLPDSEVVPGLYDIWTTSKVFLEWLGGDDEEHAVLLLNYFLYLKGTNESFDAWLLLGRTLPEFTQWIVLTKHATPGTAPVYKAWKNAQSANFSVAQQADLAPFLATFNGIGTLVAEKNIYGNVQNDDDPYGMNFEVTDKSQWSPLFPDENSRRLYSGFSAQEEPTYHFTPNFDEIERMEKEIKEGVADYIRESNPQQLVNLIRSVRSYRAILQKLEELRGDASKWQFSGGDDATGDEKLWQKLSSASLTNCFGYVFNMPFVDIKSAVDVIRNSHIHRSFSSGGYAVIACYVRPYPNNIYSVWVFVASSALTFLPSA